jgi:hypothetical protein
MREVLGAVVASLIVAGALFSYRVDRMPGDASELVNRMAAADATFTFWYHLGYAWLARLVEFVLAGPFGLTVRGTLELLSALAAGAAVGLCFVTLRRLDFTTPIAVFGTALLATTAGFLNHGTQIEVHTVQLCTSWLGLCIMARAGRLDLGRLFLFALLAGLVVSLGHQTGPLLFPGLVLTCIWTANSCTTHAERAKRFGVAVTAFLITLLASRWLTSHLSPVENLKELSDFLGATARVTKAPTVTFVAVELFATLGLLALAVFWILQTKLTRMPQAWLGLVLVIFPWAFFIGFGERTEGGYFIGSSMGCVILACLLMMGLRSQKSGKRTAAIASIALPIGSLVIAGNYVAATYADKNERAAARIAAVQELLPDGGVVFSLQYSEHTLNGQFDQLREVNICGPLHYYMSVDGVVGDADLMVSKQLGELMAAGESVIVDWTWSYRKNNPEPRWLAVVEVDADGTAPFSELQVAAPQDAGDPLNLGEFWQPYIERIRSGLDRDWRVTEHTGPWSRFLRIEPREQP